MCLCVYVYAGVATAVTAGICMLVFATNMFWQPLFSVSSNSIVSSKSYVAMMASVFTV